ncbi:MAG TPA: DUF748 domain-containing protein, partial [Steroidobacteraceae bacterium]|nr:DUF748 domain-containing protein [Steroidobacteraceae bacterium]
LAITAIVARRPYARVIIEPDRSLNVKRILSAPGAAAVAAAAAKGQPAASTGKPMRITVGQVDVEDGTADFADLSITPHFSSGIGKLNGRIRGLDSAPGARAKVDLKGEVGPYSPVSISGEVNLFGPELYTDLTMNFRNMDLTIFNPYSGKFAGYDVRKGKLTTALHYQVRGRKLVATHHVIIDQLEFGARTNSKEATSLPVKLAVALLKDRHGVIDLDIPVTGSLDDPQFRLGPLIWKVVVNIIEKAVTAPFQLLGALFGAGPQIQYVQFRPGDATLDATDLDRLRTVARALQARPLLKVDVPIAPLPSLDAPALAAARFWAQVAEQMLGLPGTAAAAHTATSTAFGALAPRTQLAVLTALYQGQYHSRPKFPPAAKPAAQSDAAKAAYLESLLRSRSTVGPGALKALAERRAIGIEKALLTGTGLEPARVFLVVNQKVAAENGAVRLQLTLR